MVVRLQLRRHSMAHMDKDVTGLVGAEVALSRPVSLCYIVVLIFMIVVMIIKCCAVLDLCTDCLISVIQNQRSKTAQNLIVIAVIAPSCFLKRTATGSFVNFVMIIGLEKGLVTLVMVLFFRQHSGEITSL